MDSVSLEQKPHYHIYKLGRDFWNSWVEEEFRSLSDFIGVQSKSPGLDVERKRKALNDVIEYTDANPDELFPSDEIDFKNTIWEEKANFEGFIFKGEVNFEFSIFQKEATFLGATFHRRALFMNCKFQETANFINSDVKMLLSFFQVRFSYVPFINGLSLNGIISFDGADWPKAKSDIFIIRQKTKIIDNLQVCKAIVLGFRHLFREFFSKGNKGFYSRVRDGLSLIESDIESYWDDIPASESYREASISNVKSAYGYLKYLANQIENHEVEMIFFRRELHAKSVMRKTRFTQGLVIFLYGLISGYGRSIVRPFFALVSSIFIFSLVYYSMFGNYLSWQACFGVSLDNTLVFLPSDKLLSGWDVNIRPVDEVQLYKYRFLRMLQLVVSIVLVFLVALGVRNELRIK